MRYHISIMLGVKQDDLVTTISNLVPDYMAMGETGMSEMSDMAAMMDIPLPEKKLPMMTGTGQYRSIERPICFTVKLIWDLTVFRR